MTSTGLPAPEVTTDPDAAQPPRLLELVVLTVPLLVALGVTRPVSDPDLWWHLRTGELVLSDGLVETDPWSFATSHSWLLHEWLSEVVLHWAYAAAGYAGVVALQAVVIGVFAAVVLLTCRRVARPDVAGLVTGLTLAATSAGFGTRPQLLSWVLLAAACPYMRDRVARREIPWLLLPLVWVWANLHGLWFTAVALFGALGLGLLLEEGVRGWRTTARFVVFGVGLLAVAAATPNGPAILLGPLRVSEYARFVTEWNPPSILHLGPACALALLAVVVVGWARSTAPVRPTTICYVALATVVGLMYSRTVPVLAIALAPLAAETLQRATGLPMAPLRLSPRQVAALLVACVVALAGVGALAVRYADPDPARPLPGTTSEAVVAAGDVLDDLPGRARVLNQYELGGWLIWAARDTSPAVDGRAELYAVDYLERYLDALAAVPGWQDFVAELDVDAALLLAETPLTGALREAGWTPVFHRDGLLVLVPPAGAA